MAHEVLASAFLPEFSCLGDKCEDTCCKGWGMQLDAPMQARYAAEAPELLDAVAEEEGVRIMKRDPATDYCVKFEDGLCGIHKRYGSGFLGDACHFYPRVTRSLGTQVLMTAVPSCPEVARLALFGEGEPFAMVEGASERLPVSLKDYLPEGLMSEQALAIHRAFMAVASEDTAEQAFARIQSVARSLSKLPVVMWPDAVPFYLESAGERLPTPEPAAQDSFNLLHALCGLMVASRKPLSPRLRPAVEAMQQALGATLYWDRVAIVTEDDSAAKAEALHARWREEFAPHYAMVLSRWLQLQLAVSLVPFAGLGATLDQRVTLLGVRFATLKLALMARSAVQGEPIADAEVVVIAQSLARALDHLADPEFSMKIYTDAGWSREARLLGLVGI